MNNIVMNALLCSLCTNYVYVPVQLWDKFPEVGQLGQGGNKFLILVETNKLFSNWVLDQVISLSSVKFLVDICLPFKKSYLYFLLCKLSVHIFCRLSGSHWSFSSWTLLIWESNSLHMFWVPHYFSLICYMSFEQYKIFNNYICFHNIDIS